MACDLVGTTPLSKPIFSYYWLGPWGDSSVIVESNTIFTQENEFEYMSSAKSRPFCLIPMVLSQWTDNDEMLGSRVSVTFHYAIKRLPDFLLTFPKILFFHDQNLNSLPFACVISGDLTYWPLCDVDRRHWAGSKFVQVMACRLLGAKTLPGQILSWRTRFGEILVNKN